VGKLISNLVPEARTLNHSIFGADPVAHSRDTDTNVENVVDVPDKTRGPEDQQEGRLTVPVETADLLSPAVEGADKSPLVFDATRHRSPTYSFSAASIEREALVLLDAIQGNSTNQGNILLAGYGFGGIVIKLVGILQQSSSRVTKLAALQTCSWYCASSYFSPT
jgi:hypothetical protein